ncbi:hypothetical protein [Phaeobacter sp. HF9A]|uniref:hypothetical protein n=1 Tax=Phaeobacter sp. HF9A TaxID=2721561 RepID=UPI00143033CF|nr:hypothetical protein [Phaeobacter sp. HF9A]NIZ15276.1 hypothetical protein [Phaeobacter sp. HF9A]
MRFSGSLMALSVLALAACDPQVPDSAAGIGEATSPFNAPPEVEAGRTLNGDPLVPGGRFADESGSSATANWQDPLPSGGASSDDIARETAAALAATGQNSGREPLQASPSNPAPAVIGNPGISDENDFEAVSNRQTIESDAERLQRQRAQYKVVSPTDVPDRPDDLSPNIVRYALSTSNPKGQRIYSRAGINLQARSQRHCAEYASADLAQTDFLEMGGPKRDRKSLDPDGDGYACGWDPAPFRAAVRAQGN